jgi:HSP20 family protein
MFDMTFPDVMFENVRRSFYRLFDDFGAFDRFLTGTAPEKVFTPIVETGWTDECYNLRVVIPGVTEKDLKVAVEGNRLRISGERKAPEYVKGDGSVSSVIPYGKFERIVDLPEGLDLEKLEAHLHDGVLDIRIPLSAAIRPRQIPISTARERQAIAA